MTTEKTKDKGHVPNDQNEKEWLMQNIGKTHD